MYPPLADKLYEAADSTVYLQRTGDQDPFEEYCRQESQIADKLPNPSYPFSTTEGKFRRRFLACSCFRGSCWSITVRANPVDESGPEPYKYTRAWRDFFGARNQYLPKNTHALGQQKPFLFSLAELSRALYQMVIPRDHQFVKGLLVVTGETSAAKSQITRGIIYHHLNSLCEDSAASICQAPAVYPYPRKPHLVTFEDPIEDLFWPDFFRDREAAPFDYTPRQKGFDVRDLDQAFGDALRQTPKVLFVGEVRATKEWDRLLDFASTGHMVITTAHAGGLREALSKIFGDKLRTPGERAEVAGRLLGVVHLATEECNGYDVAFPAVYRRTTSGAQNLVNVGLASILPNYPADDARDETGSLGRQACFDLIADECASHANVLQLEAEFQKKGWTDAARKNEFRELQQKTPDSAARKMALKMDLRGE